MTVFSDGTGRARWPSGGLAVSVDRDRHGGFRLQASYKSGGSGTAVTFDSRGVGSINFPGGATMLCVHGSGSGMIMSGKGQGTGQGKGTRMGAGTGTEQRGRWRAATVPENICGRVLLLLLPPQRRPHHQQQQQQQ